jgi:hypothetical protein
VSVVSRRCRSAGVPKRRLGSSLTSGARFKAATRFIKLRVFRSSVRSPRAPALCPGSGRRLERHQTSPAVIAEMKRKAPEAVCSYFDLIERDAQGALGDVCHRWGFLSAAAPDSQDLFFSM